jgi:hypothetical protein
VFFLWSFLTHASRGAFSESPILILTGAWFFQNRALGPLSCLTSRNRTTQCAKEETAITKHTQDGDKIMTRTTNKTFKLKHTIADNVTAQPNDVLAAKQILHDMGFYEVPDWGMTEFPDRALIDAIRSFQHANGLRVDGVMKPGGESESALQSMAQHLQGMGRRGDTVLAHISPAEASLLKERGGAGTINPDTGLLEFYRTAKSTTNKNTSDTKKGSYIWRTAGDSKVRSSHARRNGRTFSWDNPPEGGHPGEAYNCRCTAEEKKKDCEKLKWEKNAAWRRHDDLREPIEKAKGDVAKSENRLEELRSDREEIVYEMRTAAISGSLSKPGPVGAISTIAYLRLLQQKLDEIDQKIETEKQTRDIAQEKLKSLKRKQDDHYSIAAELSRLYRVCMGEE